MSIISKRLVTPEFRKFLAEYYPGLGKNQAYWEFLGYLMFGTHFDRDDKGKKHLFIPAETIAIKK